MDLEIWIESAECTNLMIRAKVGETILGQKSADVGTPPNLVVVSGLGGTAQIPGHDVVGGQTSTIDFEFSTDGGSKWASLGSGGPSKWYVMPDRNTYGETPYDLAFDKIVDYASGLSDIHSISDAIMSGVDDRLVYNAYSIPDITHILELYDMPSDVKAACQFHAGLMQYLCNASGFDALFTFVFGGESPLHLNPYVYNSPSGAELTSLQLDAPAKDDEPQNPHYLLHTLIQVDGQYYDPSYGRTGLPDALEVAPPFSGNGVVPPSQGANVHTPQREHKYGSSPGMGTMVQWTCPH